jgi:hypothetical protein
VAQNFEVFSDIQDQNQKIKNIQGADNKLGQFLIQDIYATVNHSNCLGHSLERCPSLI